ncbi:hypothetical protein PPERSA_08718 [Pseudocohnilembus persalinus]|uniref:Uncharacterized protein n=1 Tax=Pseudocohnilembus persalinus TaxID=266149 RepID=A0A0V0QY04_PSEPJ|nr:hypothetical protein PPERSA_08718 [Pseudocohnilembus persalinus]|eukprot:KRX07041.1 hypothetical protein PPERSA_08718 [Pseudocohnilembus persalinus]
MELPTNAALSKTEKAQDPSRAQQIAEQQINLVSLTQSKLLIICEEKITNNKQYEYVITVLSEESLPQTYCQFVYNAGNNPCQIKNINKKDIIVLWPEVLYNQELQFLAWNVLLKEKGCQQLQFKDQLNASIIGCSSWGANKIAFWANPTYGGRPEIKIMNTKDGTEFRGLIDCYEDEWLLCEMIHIDTEKNLAFINRIGHESTLDLIYLGKFKKIFSHKIQDDEIDLKRHFSLDNKQYIAYSDHTVGQFDQKNKELSQFNCIQLQLCQFEQFIPSRQTKLAYLMNQKNMFDIYGEKNIKKVIDFMSTRQSPIKQSIQALTKKQNNSQ